MMRKSSITARTETFVARAQPAARKNRSTETSGALVVAEMICIISSNGRQNRSAFGSASGLQFASI